MNYLSFSETRYFIFLKMLKEKYIKTNKKSPPNTRCIKKLNSHNITNQLTTKNKGRRTRKQLLNNTNGCSSKKDNRNQSKHY